MYVSNIRNYVYILNLVVDDANGFLDQKASFVGGFLDQVSHVMSLLFV
jgi:hypothetical protein